MEITAGIVGDGAARAAIVDALGVTDADPVERFERIVRAAREVLGVPLSYLNVLDDDTLHVLTARAGARQAPVSSSFCQYTLQGSEPLVIPDTTLDPRYASLPGVLEHGVRFYAGVPLTMPGGVRIGTLCVMDVVPRILSLEEQATLVDLSRWAERVLADGLQDERVGRVAAAIAPPAVDVPGYAVAGLSRPVDGLGGDLHDWADAAGDVLTFSVGDVMGSGPTVAVLAAEVRGALRARSGPDVLAAVAGLDAQLGRQLTRAGSFVSLLHGAVDRHDGTVSLVDAGHGMVLHLHRDGASEIVRSNDLPVGLHPSGVERSTTTVRLEPGDALVVATDGVLDLGDGTLDTMIVLGRKLHASRDVDGVLDLSGFLDVVRARTEERAEDDVTVVVVTRDTV